MSKGASYVAVAVVAFLAGAFSFRIVSLGGEGKAEQKRSELQEAAREKGESISREFAIEGMTCQGCVDTITSVLSQIPGVQSARVSLQDKQAVVVARESDVPTERIVAAVAKAGYKARLASAAAQSTPATLDGSNKQPILVNITRGKAELHAVSMAIGLAQSAIKDGRQAIVFLNVEAPVFAAKDLSGEVKYADFPPVKNMLADFIAAGGRVLVCGHCAHVVKLKQEDMIEGVNLLAHGELFTAITPQTTVFSY